MLCTHLFSKTCLLQVPLLLALGCGFAQSVQVATTDTRALFAVGSDRGAHVLVYGTTVETKGALLADLTPFGPTYKGGVRVAVGDVNGDGISDLIVGAGPGGGPHVIVFNGVGLITDGTSNLITDGTSNIIQDFLAYDASFTGGVFVAAGDVNGDGRAEIIVGPDRGASPNVKAFGDGSVRTSFMAYDAAFTGGVRVAAGDVNGDGRAEIIVAAGPGGGPHVKVFDGNAVNTLSFFAFDAAFQGGVYVAAGDVNGDGVADIIAGAGPGGGPQVKVFNGDGVTEKSFFAFSPTVKTGVRVGVADPLGYRQISRLSTQGVLLPYLIVAAPAVRAKQTVRMFNVQKSVTEALFGGVAPFGLNWSKGVFPTP